VSFIAFFLAVLNILSSHVCCSDHATGVVSLTKSLVWGPGLDVNIVLPVRYFFIQPVDSDGHKYVLFVVIALRE